jgi:hypothetical protein
MPEESHEVIRRQPPTPSQRRRRLLGTVAAVAVAVFASRAVGALGHPRPAPHRVAIARTFHAAGGPVTAVVTTQGVTVCEVDLLGPSGAVLARAWARTQPVTLRAVASARAQLSLVLRPAGGRTLSWQADLRGATG